jgi:hypothetical protein
VLPLDPVPRTPELAVLALLVPPAVATVALVPELVPPVFDCPPPVPPDPVLHAAKKTRNSAATSLNRMAYPV